MKLLQLLSSYRRARAMRFASRQELELHQANQWQRHAKEVLSRSPYFRPWLGKPLSQWPMMDKALMMQNFDRMNTVGLRLDDVLTRAQEAERTRNFSPRLGSFSVGLSSGTSGGRGVFVVSPQEQAQWAGVMLARLLPEGFFQRERVALFLRADNNLYSSVRTPWLNLTFFDLFGPLEEKFAELRKLQPTIVVAPAQVLRALALLQISNQLHLGSCRVISVAEVLELQDRHLLAKVFGRVDEIYQATEGFLGSTCAHGTLHINEEFIYLEKQWLDADRFVPLITDFTRRTQPVVRYRLDDVLVRRHAPCGCGRPTMVLDRIEGRCDDVLKLPGVSGKQVVVFADVINRALAQALPMVADYQLSQTGPSTLKLWTDVPLAKGNSDVYLHLSRVLHDLGVDTASLAWGAGQPPGPNFMTKRRRIRRLFQDA